MRSAYISIVAIFVVPILVYIGFKEQFPIDPESIYIKSPSLFSGKWERVGYSENFSEYVDPKRLEVNIDNTIEVVSMRNYLKPQLDEKREANNLYKSVISYETVDCFNKTIVVNKVYFMSERFSLGALVAEPVEISSRPIYVDVGSVGYNKISRVCQMSSIYIDPKHTRTNFMNNI